MDPQLEVAFGALPDADRFSKLIHKAQNAPHNWLGRKLAKFYRSQVVPKVRTPVDAEVEGIRLRTLLSDNNSERRYLFMPWLFDAEERALLADSIPSDGVFVDIGANIGIYSLWVAKHMDAKGQVLAFEPNPPAYQRLLFNVRANQEVQPDHWPKVHCVAKGVSDQRGEFSLYLDPNNLGGSSLVLHQDTGVQTQIECVTLLEQLEEFCIDRIDALKIDIEGAEDIALIPFFNTAPPELFPGLIVMERTHQDKKTPLDLVLKKAGYEVLKLTRMNAIYSLRRGQC
jgi:FkbM family methyltransferase